MLQPNAARLPLYSKRCETVGLVLVVLLIVGGPIFPLAGQRTGLPDFETEKHPIAVNSAQTGVIRITKKTSSDAEFLPEFHSALIPQVRAADQHASLHSAVRIITSESGQAGELDG